MSSLVLLLLAVALTFGAIAVAFGTPLRAPVTNQGRPAPAGGAASGGAIESDSGTEAPPIGDPLSDADLSARLHRLALGADLEPPQAAAHAEVAALVADGIPNIATEPRYAPRRPLLLPQLLQAVNDDDTSRRELAAIIARDPALVGSLLKLANSAFYRIHARPIENIERAVAVLGTQGIRSLVATAVTQPVFRATSRDFARFPEIAWEHTFRSATAAEAYAAFVEKTDRFAAQLLGLLMGLGTIAVFRMTLDRYAAHPAVQPSAAVVAGVIDRHAADAARLIAASWGLSDRILLAFAHPAAPDDADEPARLGRSLRFGRIIAALAVLHAHELVEENAVRATLAAHPVPAGHAERIWNRMASST